MYFVNYSYRNSWENLSLQNKRYCLVEECYLNSFVIQNDVRWRQRHTIIHVTVQAVSSSTVLPKACQLSEMYDSLIANIGKYPITYHIFIKKISWKYWSHFFVLYPIIMRNSYYYTCIISVCVSFTMKSCIIFNHGSSFRMSRAKRAEDDSWKVGWMSM